jgi:hypothetical protein
MKKWLKVIGILLIVAVAIIGWGRWSNHKLRASVEETRRQLQREGFKTELTDFNLTLAGEMRQRANVIVATSSALGDGRAIAELRLMKIIGANTALRTTSSPFITSQFFPPSSVDQAESEAFRRRYMAWPTVPTPSPSVTSDLEVGQPPVFVNLWDQIHAELYANSASLDAACQAVGGGEFRFEPTAHNGDFLVPELARIKGLAQALSARTALAVHEQRMDDAFSNLLALTQLITRWQPEPIEVSHLVRFGCVNLAQAPLWEALQAEGWSDTQLAALQEEWESAEFFADLPETAALYRAILVQMCRNARAESLVGDYGGWGPAIRQLTTSVRSSPKNGFQELRGFIAGYRNQRRYQNVGSYEDEKGLLLYCRDREVEMKRAVTCQTWEEMRAFPGVTNYVPYQGSQPSRMTSMVNVRQIGLGYAAEGRRPLGRAAETETRRRLVVTAIALKRFQVQHGGYPATLAELTPTLLRSVPVDFMDGKELRYRKFEDGRFILYSVGLDCVDNGGQVKTREQIRQQRWLGDSGPFWLYQNTDIVWPMPANEQETLFYELSTDELVIRLNEIMLEEIVQKYLPPRPEEIVCPVQYGFE